MREIRNIAKLHSQGTDELVVEVWKNMLQLVGSREGLAGLGPPPGADDLPGTRGGSPLHRATGRMTFDVRAHVRSESVRRIVHVRRSMSVSMKCVCVYVCVATNGC